MALRDEFASDSDTLAEAFAEVFELLESIDVFEEFEQFVAFDEAFEVFWLFAEACVDVSLAKLLLPECFDNPLRAVVEEEEDVEEEEVVAVLVVVVVVDDKVLLVVVLEGRNVGKGAASRPDVGERPLVAAAPSSSSEKEDAS